MVQRAALSWSGGLLLLLLLLGLLGLHFAAGLGDPARLVLQLRGARPLPGSRADAPEREGQLVAVTGRLRAAQPLGDPGLLQPGDYVEIWRDVEIFAWHEEPLAPQLYRHVLRFSPDPPDTASMREPAGHENPKVPLRSDVLSAREAWVGAYRFVPARARMAAEPLSLTRDLLTQDDRRHRLAAGCLYIGSGTPEAPHLGDLRVCYAVVRAGGIVTLFGEKHGDTIIPKIGPRGTRLYHLLPGSLPEALSALPRLREIRPALLSP
jgi:hypothetical protein